MDPMKHLMKDCDDKAQKALETMNSQSEENKMEKVGKQCIITNGKMIDRPVRETVRMVDAMESEKNYLFEKSAENCNFIDKEARNVFPKGPISSSTQMIVWIKHAWKKGVPN